MKSRMQNVHFLPLKHLEKWTKLRQASEICIANNCVQNTSKKPFKNIWEEKIYKMYQFLKEIWGFQWEFFIITFYSASSVLPSCLQPICT